jgi:hypothetical protein
LRQTGDGWRVSGSRAVIDIIGADHRAKEFLHLIGIFVYASGAADACDGVGSAFRYYLFEFVCDEVQCLIP